MKKVVLFGAGEYYQKYKKYIEDEIIAICDNAKEKKGKIIDGHIVISPDEIMHYHPDEIIMLSVYINEIKDQLCELGIDSSIIKPFYDIKYEKEIKEKIYYNSTLEPSKETKKKVLVISHELSTTGAPIALLEAVHQLRNLGYYITVASPDDGDMREAFLSYCDQIIIDERLRTSKLSEIEWTSVYNLVFVNTVKLFYLLRSLKPTQKVLWWLHEPECFYSSVDSRCLKEINYSQVSLNAVSVVAKEAFLKRNNAIHCNILPYGKSDCPRTKKKSNCNALNCIVIGGISKLKGHDRVVDAVSRLCNAGYMNMHFQFVGNDTSEFALRIKEVVLQNRLPITFTGEMNNSTTLDMIEDSNLLLCASEVESLSVSVTEGMMKEVACLIPSTAGNCEYVTNGENGLIFDRSDTEDLFRKLQWCVDNIPSLALMGNKGRKIYETYFSVESFCNSLIEALNMIFA